jgi:hypothetical protein
VLVEGRVRRAPHGGRVRLRLERRVADGWVAARHGRAHIGRGGRFDHLFRSLKAGRYRVVAVYPGSHRTHRSQAERGFRLRR